MSGSAPPLMRQAQEKKASDGIAHRNRDVFYLPGMTLTLDAISATYSEIASALSG